MHIGGVEVSVSKTSIRQVQRKKYTKKDLLEARWKAY